MRVPWNTFLELEEILTDDYLTRVVGGHQRAPPLVAECRGARDQMVEDELGDARLSGRSPTSSPPE